MKIFLYLILLSSLLFSETLTNLNAFIPKINEQTISDINFYENRSSLSPELKAFLEGDSTLETKVYSLKIPPILNTDISCGGFRASMGDVLGIIQGQLEGLAEQIPAWLVQEALGVPLDSPTEILKIIVDFMVEGYCWGEVAGVQLVQTAAEGTIDLTSRLFETYETETEKAVGTPNLNGNVDMPAAGHSSEKTNSPAINETASAQATEEATEQTSKETFKKVAECVKAKKKFIAEVMDTKVNKFKPLAYSKKEVLKSACEIIKEKAKATNLNDKWNIPGTLYSPLKFKASKREDILKLKNGMILLEKSEKASAINAWLNNDKLNKFFENDLKLKQYDQSAGNINKKILTDLGLSILNGLTTCINNPDQEICKKYEADPNFFFNFIHDSNQIIEGFQNKLIQKKLICSTILGYKYNPEILRDFYYVITKQDSLDRMSIEQANFITKNYIEKEFCGKQLKKEIYQLKNFLNNKLKDQAKQFAADYAETLSQLKAYKVLNAAIRYKGDNEKLVKVCAFPLDKNGKPGKIYYQTIDGSIHSTSGSNGLSNIEKTYNVEIANLPLQSFKLNKKEYMLSAKLVKNNCEYDTTTTDFQKLYQDYLEGQKKQVVKKRPLSLSDYKEKLLKERINYINNINQINGLTTELNAEVLENILQKRINEIILKLSL